MARNNQKRLYLYLLRRDKKGMKVLSIFRYKQCPPTRITDLSSLKLPQGLRSSIQKTVYDNRMLWEPWLESAESYQHLRESLKKRGIRNIPLPSTPMHILSPKNYVRQEPTSIEPDLSDVSPIRGMTRRKKS